MNALMPVLLASGLGLLLTATNVIANPGDSWGNIEWDVWAVEYSENMHEYEKESLKHQREMERESQKHYQEMARERRKAHEEYFRESQQKQDEWIRESRQKQMENEHERFKFQQEIRRDWRNHYTERT